MRITAFLFRQLVAGSIVRRQFLRRIPAEFGPLRRGDYSPLADFVPQIRRVRAFGMRAAMDCASGISAARWQRVLRERESLLLQGVSDFPFPEVCEAWGIPDLGDEFRAAFDFGGPVLFITAGLDGLTPASNLDQIQPGFPNSGRLTVEGMGHEGPGVWHASPEVLEIVGRFLQGAPPQTTLVKAPPINWVLPEAR